MKTISISDDLYSYLERVSEAESLPTPLCDSTKEYHGKTPDQVCSRIISEWMILQAQAVIPLATVDAEGNIKFNFNRK